VVISPYYHLLFTQKTQEEILMYTKQAQKSTSKISKLVPGSGQKQPQKGHLGHKDLWKSAQTLLPRCPVPWEHFTLADSIRQLARSCAVIPDPLPGAALSILAGIIGRAADITPKPGWREPLIMWHADIRESGEGKTPPVRMLMKPLSDWQQTEDDRHDREMREFESLSKEEKKVAQAPAPVRTYFGTDTTIEGLRTALQTHPTGGLIVQLDELSSFFNSQNQYKGGKGADRESWLCLHDGNPARVIRAGKTVSIYGGRVQVYGGIQPAVLQQLLVRNNVYKDDGTFYRFLLTFSRSSFCELTSETWSEKHRNRWTATLEAARTWSHKYSKNPRHLYLDSEAQNFFLNWRNKLFFQKNSLPVELHGFIPKAVGYALRLTGVLHCLSQFANNDEPQEKLGTNELKAGIAFAEYYLGQTVDALHFLQKDNDTHTDSEKLTNDTRVLSLTRTLSKVEDQIENNRIAIGYLTKIYNKIASRSDQINSPRAMGEFLRGLGLTVPGSKHTWRGKRGVCCLVCDDFLWNLKNNVSNVSNVCAA
jgi:hypothetical protein